MAKSAPFTVRTTADFKRIELELRGTAGAKATVRLTAPEVTELIAALLTAGNRNYAATHDAAHISAGAIGKPEDVYARFVWPINIAVAQPSGREQRNTIGIAAGYGDVQMVVGLQRNELKKLSDLLAYVDSQLPPSDGVETSL